MKRKLLINQYESVRESIEANVCTIGTLLEQIKKLSELADSLKKVEGESEVFKKIEDMALNLKKSIIELIKKTMELSEEYYKFGEEVFEK